MVKTKYRMKAKVWVYPGKAGWHFVTLPKKESGEIRKIFGVLAAGFGSLPVTVTIGKTSWKTSIFPESKEGSYLLPLKKEVRKEEGITKDDNIIFEVEIRV